MKPLILSILLLASAGAQAQAQYRACGAALADGATTAAALSAGSIVEANPLMPAGIGGILAVTGIKCGMAAWANEMPEPQRTEALNTQEAAFGGAAVANLAILLTHSNPLGWAVGIGYGLYRWNATAPEREAARNGAEQLARELHEQYKATNTLSDLPG